jgi:hypothetical protein
LTEWSGDANNHHKKPIGTVKKVITLRKQEGIKIRCPLPPFYFQFSLTLYSCLFGYEKKKKDLGYDYAVTI